MSDPTKAPPGWYADGSGGRRYWDGDAWTDYTVPGASMNASATDATTTPPNATATDATTTPPNATATDATTTRLLDTGYDGTQPTAVLAPHPFTEPSNPGPSVVGIIALIVAVAGFVVACIPAVLGFAWILLPIAFVLSLVGLFLRGAKWPAVTGLVVSILGTIVGIAVFVSLVAGSFTDVFEQIEDAIPDASELEQPGDGVPGLPLEVPAAPDQPGALADGLAFGETMVWSDGVALTVSAPEPFTPSEFAAGATLPFHVVFTLTITNDSSEDLQPVPLPTLTSGGQDASQIFDVSGEGEDVGIPPIEVIPPGGSVTWRVAWSVADPQSLTMEAAPSFLYEDAIFTNVP
ncbi:DUF2510 domain-containing protein [Agromyces bauzanensis]